MRKKQREFELVAFEKLLVHFGLNGMYNVMSTCFLEFARDLDEHIVIDYETLKQALIIMQRRHPFWRACLECDRNVDKMCLVLIDDEQALKKIQFEHVQLEPATGTRQRLIDESAKFNVRLFDSNRENLLWRVQLISYTEESRLKYVLNLVQFMILTDGFNACTLAVEIANILNALIGKRECLEMKIQLEPKESFYVYCEKTNLFKSEHYQLIEKLKRERKGQSVKFLLPDKFRSNEETGFRLDMFKFDPSLTESIMKTAKVNNTRITAYFYTALIYALRKLYLENELTFPDELLLEIPASLRIRYEPNLEFTHCRTHITLNTFVTNRERFGDFKNFWHDCEYIGELIKQTTCVETGALFYVTHSFEYFNQICKLLNECSFDVMFNFSSNDVALSNLGSYFNEEKRLNVSPDEPFLIREIYCSDSLLIPISPALIPHIIYWKGEMMIQFGANATLLSGHYFKRLVELFKNTVYETVEK